MIDWSQVSELHDEIGAVDFDEVVALFLQEVEGALADLPDQAREPAALEAALHFLKGSALNLGFDTLAHACQEGEYAARAGTPEAVDLGAIARLYEDSRAAFLRELPERLAA
ncbi:Hpt domain-containing protein [Salipiger abyssi]|uniref:Hpt domain-containing protein n=1 Tax=Salipiger abyssi TaxID=1250539 RepID=UPI001A8F0732|nr:Hpt domain-containing protein [Salipiger abyssi]MBN9886068.1 Hpt domain-containing protein [Salipiger abyssi]